MDYEKKYKEAEKWIESIYSELSHEQQMEAEAFFLELKENEDEKVRKEIQSAIEQLDKDSTLCGKKYDYNQWLAWLEKQKEPELSEDLGEYVAELSKQFPEVSFAKLSRIAVRVKNWFEKRGEPVEINPTEFDTRLQALIGKFETLPKEELIGSLSFWLNVVQNDGTYKDKEKQGESYGQRKECLGCQFNYAGECKGSCAMKRDEQKPAEWSEEDKKMIGRIRYIIEDYAFAQYAVDVNGDLCEKEYIDADNWLKSLKDRVQPKQEWKQENIEELTEFENAMMHIGGSFFGRHAGLDPNDTASIKEQAKLLLELAPKQEWSKEDETKIRAALAFIKSEFPKEGNEEIMEDTIEWLKSLRPQPKQEWSKEDENTIKVLMNIIRKSEMIDSIIYTDSLKEKLYDWLKSIKQRIGGEV